MVRRTWKQWLAGGVVFAAVVLPAMFAAGSGNQGRSPGCSRRQEGRPADLAGGERYPARFAVSEEPLSSGVRVSRG